MLYVSPLKKVKPDEKWQWQHKCTLWADMRAELYEIARKEKCELKIEWMKEINTFPHFIINMSKRKKAVELGAKEVSNKVLDKARGPNKTKIIKEPVKVKAKAKPRKKSGSK